MGNVRELKRKKV